jgi:hypothetical protein
MTVISSVLLLVALPNCNATPCLWGWLVAYCHGNMCLRNSHKVVKCRNVPVLKLSKMLVLITLINKFLNKARKRKGMQVSCFHRNVC